MACTTHGLGPTWLAAATLVLAACGDDGSSEGGGDDAAASTSTTSPGTDSAATTSGGSTDPDPTIASASASGDTTSGTTSGTTTGVDSSGGTDTGAVVCEDLDAKACLAEKACMSIGGQPIVIERDGACLAEREFIECQPAIGCDDALTYACEGDDAPMYQFPDTCLPTGWVDCGMPPPGDLMPCP